MLGMMIALAFAAPAPQDKVCATAAAEAKAKPWYISNAEIRFRGRAFRKFGLPRVLSPGEVAAAGTYRGLPVFVPTDTTLGEDVVYLVTTSKGCEFQPYAVKLRG